MKQVTVTVARPFTHGGRAYRRGDAVTLTAIEATLHARQGLVSLSRQPSVKTRDLTADPPPPPPLEGKPRRGRYRRRDLVAEE